VVWGDRVDLDDGEVEAVHGPLDGEKRLPQVSPMVRAKSVDPVLPDYRLPDELEPAGGLVPISHAESEADEKSAGISRAFVEDPGLDTRERVPPLPKGLHCPEGIVRELEELRFVG
jgi:hypothetical protein